MIPISHYGLHQRDGLVFLHEQSGESRCLNTGLGRLPSPFVLTMPGARRCPHRLGTPEQGECIDHPLVRAMGPAQDAGLYFVEERDVQWLWRLADMTPTTTRIVEPYLGPLIRAAPKLTLTNAAPLVLTDWDVKHFAEIEQLSRMFRIRNLIICGPRRIPGAQTLSPRGLDDFIDHDWPAEGRRQLYHYVRSFR